MLLLTAKFMNVNVCVCSTKDTKNVARKAALNKQPSWISFYNFWIQDYGIGSPSMNCLKRWWMVSFVAINFLYFRSATRRIHWYGTDRDNCCPRGIDSHRFHRLTGLYKQTQGSSTENETPYVSWVVWYWFIFNFSVVVHQMLCMESMEAHWYAAKNMISYQKSCPL